MLKQVSETKHILNIDESMIGHPTGNQNRAEEIGPKPDIKYITEKKNHRFHKHAQHIMSTIKP